MGHFKEGPPEEFWKGFQQHMGYTDEEMKRFKKDAKKVKTAPKMASPRMRNSTMVIEVVEAHGCAEGMKVGDKLYFTGIANLDPARSSRWCAYALSHITNFANLYHNMILQGLDPNEACSQYSACMDCGTDRGWGGITMKAYVIDEGKK